MGSHLHTKKETSVTPVKHYLLPLGLYSSKAVKDWSLGELVDFSPSNPGGKLPYKGDEDTRRKIKIKPIRETNVGVAQT